EIPVPAAAYLFGSAILGLGVLRRKKQHMPSPSSP
ncbi:MAG: VPLPA-CTERM sorting domain-containing protein, partial [Gammaproteobacteria bacterium]|nr:VPLPA-CTERM sorting domain-containing protein [Gammaproteobacteria bacterium]